MELRTSPVRITMSETVAARYDNPEFLLAAPRLVLP